MRIDRAKFAAAMVLADLNGNQLAEKAGVSRGTITAVRTGKSCSRETAEKLASMSSTTSIIYRFTTSHKVAKIKGFRAPTVYYRRVK